MPEFDGKGPRGLGLMTGGGRGFCALRLPAKPGEPVDGFVGLGGRPLDGPAGPGGMNVSGLQSVIDRLSAEIHQIGERVTRLKQRRSDASETTCGCTLDAASS